MALAKEIDVSNRPVVLAGFMRILTDAFVVVTADVSSTFIRR
jgi:folate-dependent phosphoribosylglycinamide formyltransferase PurN